MRSTSELLSIIFLKAIGGNFPLRSVGLFSSFLVRDGIAAVYSDWIGQVDDVIGQLFHAHVVNDCTAST